MDINQEIETQVKIESDDIETQVKIEWLKAEYDCTNNTIRNIIRNNFESVDAISSSPKDKIDKVFDQTRGSYSIWKQVLDNPSRKWEYQTIFVSYKQMFEWSGWPTQSKFEVNDPVIILALDEKTQIHVLEGNHRVSSMINNKQEINVGMYICHLESFSTPNPFWLLKYDWLLPLKEQISSIYNTCFC